MNKLLGWETFFSLSYKTISNKKFTKNQRQSFTNGYAQVQLCLFYDITSPQTGASIFYSVSDGYFLVEFSSFMNCHMIQKSSTDAGAIYVESSHFLMQKVCGYECTSVKNCGFASLKLTSDNYALECSISNCEANEFHTIYTEKGNIKLNKMNLTNNICTYTSSIYSYPTKSVTDQNKVGTIFSYCSFINNQALQYTTLSLWNSGFEYELLNINIISNKQNSTNGGLILNYGKAVIQNSCISDNIGSPIFQNNGVCTLINCSVTDKSVIGTSLNIEQIGTISFSNEFDVISLGGCVSNLMILCTSVKKVIFPFLQYQLLFFTSFSFA